MVVLYRRGERAPAQRRRPLIDWEKDMAKSALELIPGELQGVALGESDIARAVGLAQPNNQRVREAADARLRFEDEPAAYLALLEEQGDSNDR